MKKTLSTLIEQMTQEQAGKLVDLMTKFRLEKEKELRPQPIKL